MRSFLDDLRRAPTPLALISRTAAAKAAKDSYVALLKTALSDAERENEQDDRSLHELRRYAVWLEDITFEGDVGNGDLTSMASIASTIYEFLGRAGIDDEARTIFESPLNDLLRSAALGSFNPYSAQPSIVARRIREIVAGFTADNARERVQLLVATVLAQLLGREFHGCFSSALAVRAAVPDALIELRENDAHNIDYIRVDQAFALSEACRLAAAGMLVGAPVLLVESMKQLERLAAAATQSEDEQHYWLARRFGAVVNAMNSSSMHRILHEHQMPIEFRRALARDGFFELWQPQIEAIEKGLLDDDDPPNFVVGIPTGAGKTLIAELAILHSLQGESGGWAIYVTPSRALVNQVSSDLRRRLDDCGIKVRTVLAGAEQSGSVDIELELLTAGKTVTVTTPEKLDAYYRNAQAAFDSCKLIIFDEVHKIAEPARGPLLESLITRFLSLQPNARIVMLSGVLSNSEDMVAWLGETKTQSVIMRRRPGRQVRGLAVRYDAEPQARRKSTRGYLRRVTFSGGLVLVHEREDVEGGIEVQLQDVFDGFYTERRYTRGWREDRKAIRSTRNGHALSITETLLRMPGTTLVFVQNTGQAEKACRELTMPESVGFEAERVQLADFLASELGADHELVTHCRAGKAFHHARLPASVQRAVELALEQGWVRAVFSTPTLREGLNTAATNVILAGNTYWDDGLVDVDPADFENLAGRAGRPFRELEGLAILVPDSLATAYAVDAAKRYLVVGEEALRARSQLGDLAHQLEVADGNLRNLSVGQQSLLLGLKAAGLADKDQLADFFEQSLWSVQEEQEGLVEVAAAGGALAFQEATESLGDERLSLAARTGLSLSSVEVLFNVLEPESDHFEKSDSQGQLREVMTPLLNAALQLEEIRRGSLGRDVDWSYHLEPVLSWMNGDPYDDVLSSAISSGVLSGGSTIGDAVKYAADVSTWISWSLGASCMVLESILDDLDPIVGSLPLLVKYGVPTTAAAYISLLGVADRSAARTLGERFVETGRSASIEQISEWMNEIDSKLDELLPGHGLKSELVRRQAFRARREPLPYMFARLSLTGKSRRGDVLALRADGNGGVLGSIEGNDVAEFAQPDSILRFGQGSLDGLAAVLTARRSGGKGAAAVIRLATLGD